MISDELLNKFDSIEDLPVSEEMLGAYLENNLSAVEHLQIEQQIINNPELSTFIKVISEEKIDFLQPNDAIDKSYILPEIPSWEKMTDYRLQLGELGNNTTIEYNGRNKKIKR